MGGRWSSRVAGVLPALTLGAVLSVAVVALSWIGAFAGWETRAVDAFLFLRDPVPAPEVVLVLIDDEAFRALGERQPLSRRALAALADVLLRSGARVVALDVLLQTPTTSDEDAALVAVARRWAPSGRLVLAREAVRPPAGEGYVLRPHFSPSLGGLSGFINAPIDADGLVRRFHPVLPGEHGGLHPSLALATVAASAGVGVSGLARALGSGLDAGIALPVSDGAGHLVPGAPIRLRALAREPWRISFAGPPGTLLSFPAGLLLGMAASGQPAAEDNPFRDRIVLIGGSFAASRDLHPTPTGFMAGVEIHGNAVRTLLARGALRPPPWWLNLAVLLGACLGVAALSAVLPPVGATLASLALVAGIVASSYEAYTRGGYWLDFVAPVAAVLLYQHGARVVRRRRLRLAFGQYVSPEVMTRVVRAGSVLGGEMRQVSVLVSDLRGFTSLCERRRPEEVTALMNEYLTAMVDRILAHQGMISDFIGDGILAFFGAPLDEPEHAWQAVRSAVEMQAALDRLNARWARGGVEALAMGIAVNSGLAFAGTIGAPRKKKYAVLGDTVNTAARIESLNRQLGTRVLIGRETMEAVRGRVVLGRRDAVAVKGKAEPVEVFELLGLADHPAAGSAPRPAEVKT
jgi:adenylate cyclase